MNDRLASIISGLLQEEINRKGFANFAVSAGRTPMGLLNLLADKEVDWAKVNLTLADERWVKTSSRDSNEKELRETLLQGKAGAARFFPLRGESQDLDRRHLAGVEKTLLEAGAFPFDILTLGLGEDGHTASLFPCADEIYEAMDPGNPDLLARISPRTAPYDRITFTRAALQHSGKIFLHIIGATKLEVLKKAEDGDNPMEMPVRAFLKHPSLDLEIYWAPR